MKVIHPQRPAGFSLAEVVLATGVCSVALMSLIGALGVSLTAERSSARDTALAAMSSQVVTQLSRRPFEEIEKATALPSYYFDSQGVIVPGAIGPDDLRVAYACEVAARPCEEMKNPATGSCNLVRLQLTYTWDQRPGNGAGTEGAPGNNGHQRMYASLARY